MKEKRRQSCSQRTHQWECDVAVEVTGSKSAIYHPPALSPLPSSVILLLVQEVLCAVASAVISEGDKKIKKAGR